MTTLSLASAKPFSNCLKGLEVKERSQTSPKTSKLTISIPSFDSTTASLSKLSRHFTPLNEKAIRCSSIIRPSKFDKYNDPLLQAQMTSEIERAFNKGECTFLGNGATGSVYSFEFKEKKYAFKIVNPDCAYTQTLKREFNFSHLLDSHPNLMTVYFPTVVNISKPIAYRSPCLVMEYLSGTPLIDNLLDECPNAKSYRIAGAGIDLLQRVKSGDEDAKQELSMHLDRLRSLFVDTAGALKHMHAQGLIHRDVKPENIMLAEDSTSGTRHVLYDFGEIRDLSTGNGVPERFTERSSSEIRPLTPCGTEFYRSPEVYLGSSSLKHRYTHSSDIWALGVTAHAAAIGSFPFDIAKSLQYSEVLKEFELQKSALILPDALPPQLADLLNQCLDTDGSKRISADDILMHPFITDPDGVINSLNFKKNKSKSIETLE